MSQYNNINESRIQKLIKSNTATVLETKYCTAFDQYLCDNYPWIDITGYSIDWNKVKTTNYKRLNWAKADEKQRKSYNFISKT